jgi:phage RecT family recombinase
MRKDDIATIVATIDHQQSKYADILPSNVNWGDFRNAFLISVQRNPRLLEADRQSLWLGLQSAASDGLKPDGREGALVIFGDDGEDEEGNVVVSTAKGKKKVVWMPMVWGITKQMRNTGNIGSVRCKVIYRGERVIITDKDGKETYEHTRVIDAETDIDESDQNIVGAYAVVTYKDGFWDAEFMTRKAIDRVKAVSKAKKGAAPWNKWYPQMAMKCPLRRLSMRVEKSAVNERYFKAIVDDATMTIEGENATEIVGVVGAIEQDNSIKQEFSPSKQGEKVAAATGAATKKEAVRQQEEAKRQPETETRQPKEDAPVNTDSANKEPAKQEMEPEPVEIWAVDDNGEPIERAEPMTAMEFANWFAASLFLAKHADALREHNADAIGDAGTDPKAAAVITDAIARHAKREGEKTKETSTAPSNSVAAETEKPKRVALVVPKTPKGALHWGNYGPLAKADIATLRDAADIEDWITVNRPVYLGKASEIAIDNWLRDRRKALGIGEPAEPVTMTHTEFLTSITAQVGSCNTEDQITEWSKGAAIRAHMIRLKVEAPDTFAKACDIIDERRLAVAPVEDIPQ